MQIKSDLLANAIEDSHKSNHPSNDYIAKMVNLIIDGQTKVTPRKIDLILDTDINYNVTPEVEDALKEARVILNMLTQQRNDIERACRTLVRHMAS